MVIWYLGPMEKCPLCFKAVSHLQGPTHIFPAWLDSSTVEALVCEPCEKRFERTEAFAAEFFKEHKYLKKTTEPDYYDTFFGSENHHKSARIALLYFLVGLSLKQHLNGPKHGEDLLGSTFERLARDYSGRFIEENDYQFLAVKQTEHETEIAAPKRARIEEFNAIEILILGYRFFVFNDQRPLPEDSPIRQLAKEHELVIMVEHSSEEPVYKNFLAFMEERGA